MGKYIRGSWFLLFTALFTQVLAQTDITSREILLMTNGDIFTFPAGKSVAPYSQVTISDENVADVLA